MSSNSAAPGDNELAVSDLGPLAWVLDELRKSLDGATKALRRFVRDAELARGSNLSELDASHLRIARQQLHQAVGALEMVGLSAPAKMLRAMEGLAQKFVQRPELCSEDAANRVERASFALTEYLEGVLKGKTASSVALFPQYRAVLELAGGESGHPADLWPIEWRWLNVPLQPGIEAQSFTTSLRGQMDQAVLRVMRTGDRKAARRMGDLCAGLAVGQAQIEPRTFWAICAAFFEGVALGLCPDDVYTKRAASRVLRQYTSLAKGDMAISDRLAHDLVFFCSLSVPGADQSAPALKAVRAAYGLERSKPVQYETEQFGRFDPALMVLARKRIAAAAETWSALAGGDTNRLKVVTEQFGAVSESVIKLHPESGELGRALTRAIDSTVRSGAAPVAPVAMEVATAILYLEAAYDDLDPTEANMAERSARLAVRLEHVSTGGQPEPLESWMEELYRRVSDRQTMGSVVDELRTTLAEVEKSLDQFFRNPQDKAPLREVPSQLAQMRGVFSVLGLDQPSLAALRMRASVEQFLVDDIDEATARRGIFEKLGNSLGAMGFLIDMLSYQRALAKKLFVYDEDLGEFKPLMGRERAPDEAVAEPEVVQAPEAAPVQAAVEPAFDTTQALSAPVAPVVPAAAAPVAPVVEELSEDEAELIDIFLEEAREVVQNGLAAVSALVEDPSNLADQTTLRRAFHTLKGSSRMVGLNEFGEAAWSFEQLFNNWLAEQRPASEDLITAASTAMQAFGRWVDDIANHTAGQWNAQDFRKSSDSLRLNGIWIPLVTPAAAAPQPVVSVPEVLEAAELVETSEAPAVDVALAQSEPEVTPAEEEARPDFASTQTFGFENTQAFPHDSKPGVREGIQGATEVTEVDFGDFDFGDLSGAAKPEPVREEPALPAAVEEPVVAAFEPATEEVTAAEASAPQDGYALLDAELVEPEALAEPQPEPLPELLEDLAVVEPLLVEPEPEPVVEPEPTAPVLEAPVDELELAVPEVLLVPEAPVVVEEIDEQVKVIGHLRLSIPLYNVYLNEADEWSRRLQVELSEWAMELQKPLPDSLVSLAHSLLGSSATVGFTALSDMARALEQALQHVQLHRQGTAEQAEVFSNAAEDIRRLLHQFAAGFLKESDADVLAALQTIIETEFPAATIDSVADALDDELALPEVEEQELHAVVDTPAAEAVVPAPAVFEPTNVPAPAPLSVVAAPLNIAQAEDDDDIDARDSLDDDLFPIFEEEAIELMPQLGTALRAWVGSPDNLKARNEVLRVLHTLKGSARLAGAMRLGEMSHRMESSIEQIGTEQIQQVQLEPLLTRFDGLQATFNALGGAPVAVEVAPVEVLPAATTATAGVTPAVTAAPVRVAPRGLAAVTPVRQTAHHSVRVRSQLLDRLVNQAGEVMISRARMEARLTQLRASLTDLTGNLERLRSQLRDVELQSESQMQSRLAQTKDSAQAFDPLEFDRFTRVQELTRMMAESVHDVATVQRNLQRSIEGAEDDLIAQGRQARELQRDLLRTRMVEFESISDRLYGVVRQAAKDSGKQVKLDITGGSIEMDRGVLDRMGPAFEHMLRNSVAHGVESAADRVAAGKAPVGTITIHVNQESNDVSVSFSDDGGGLHLDKIRAKAIANGVLSADETLSDSDAANLIFTPGFSTADQVTELSGRGIGMDVVRSEVNALGGRIETATEYGRGTTFKVILPLTTAVTQVVMLRVGEFTIGVPSGLVETVLRTPAAVLEQAYQRDGFDMAGQMLPFFWAGALLQVSAQSTEPQTKTRSVAVFRSAGQRLALHVDEILGNREVVVKNLGPQLAQLPGLAGVSVLASGAVALIYNPVALAAVYGDQARALHKSAEVAQAAADSGSQVAAPTQTLVGAVNQVPLILVVDDSITVRRVTQRLLKREGYRVALASDGLDALEKLQEEKPTVVLSDIEMPRMDGFDLARNIRGDAKLRDLPIIMITSRIAGKHREHAKELGVDHYLGKPYSEDELLGLVRSYCATAVVA
ncbi:Hpt domain-containing protein [Rhodoferax sp. AJA081-3]|uniref:hybrid sensor histidine kinase/response regulator n=1 Tax=Rhodoferax sp. AJA081-3 TaxID=2752316 RepID=UPI001AE0CF84|nr:Hpt domain-containing protein [Rhodoferax sp. AJA081-3]QTN27413.1 Hpt domain-containing protein [Rhodoferax sp. AJA081-3]